MKYVSIFGKLKCLEELISSSAIYPIFLGIFVVLIALLFTKKIRNKKVVVLMLIDYLVLLIITILNNYKALSTVFDSIATNLFTNIYFPSTQVYLFTLVLIDIITISSLLNIRCEKVYRVANGICFFVTKFIMILILEVVSKNKIDIFSKKSLFTNTNLVILLEISIAVFIIWLISLAVIYITNKVTERITVTLVQEEKNTNPSILPNTLVVESPKEDVKIPREEQELSPLLNTISNVEKTPIKDSFSLNDLTISVDTIEEEKPIIDNSINEVSSDILLDRLLNNGLPVIREEKNTLENNQPQITKNDYTLNDYKIFNKMLKEVREINNSNIINIDKNLENRLMLKYTKEEYNLFKGMLKNYSN